MLQLRLVAVLLPQGFRLQLFGRQLEPALLDRPAQSFVKLVFHRREGDPVLRAFGPGERGFDGRQVQVEDGGVLRLALFAPEQILLAVRFDPRDFLIRAACEPQVAEGLVVHREKANGGAVFRRHVRDRRTVRQGEFLGTGAEVLDEFFDHAVLTKHLGDSQHKVGRGRALGKFSRETDADHLRGQHVDRLPEHHRLRFDATHSPPEHAEAVDHRRVAVRADESIGQQHGLTVDLVALDHLAEELQIDLVHDAGCRGHSPEILERLGPPAEEFVPFAVAFELLIGIDLQRLRAAEGIHLDGMVDHKVYGDVRIDSCRIASEQVHRGAQRRKIHNRGNAGKVLQDHPGGLERQLLLAGRFRVPVSQAADMILGHHLAIDITQHCFEQDANRIRQLADAAKMLFFESREAVIGSVTLVRFQPRLRAKWIFSGRRHVCPLHVKA